MRTLSRGTNADLIANVATIYVHDGMQIADVTYGKGVFWRKCRQYACTLYASDLYPIARYQVQGDMWQRLRIMPLQADFRCLPYGTGTLDLVVLDPPYIHNPGQHLTDKRYNNAATTGGMYHRDIVARLYLPGILEAARVLKPGGQLWVKCKDEIESSTQQWAHREMYDLALALDYFTGKDCAVLHAEPSVTTKRWERQLHLRKNHSVLWIFERTPSRVGLPRRHGGDRKSPHFLKNQADKNISLIPGYGTDRQYLLARLAKDYPYHFVRYVAGDFRSVHAAWHAARHVGQCVNTPQAESVYNQEESTP